MKKIYYDVYKQLKLCVHCGKEKATEGKTTCFTCAEKDSQRVKTYDKERKSNYRKRKRELCDAFGICTSCIQREKYKGKECIECYLKRRRKYKEKVLDSNKIPRELWGELNLCAICGNPVSPGHKLCDKHLEIARENIAKAREQVDYSSHTWNLDKRVDIYRLQALGNR